MPLGHRAPSQRQQQHESGVDQPLAARGSRSAGHRTRRRRKTEELALALEQPANRTGTLSQARTHARVGVRATLTAKSGTQKTRRTARDDTTDERREMMRREGRKRTYRRRRTAPTRVAVRSKTETTPRPRSASCNTPSAPQRPPGPVKFNERDTCLSALCGRKQKQKSEVVPNRRAPPSDGRREGDQTRKSRCRKKREERRRDAPPRRRRTGASCSSSRRG